MSPVTSLKRRSLTTDDQQPQKRSKLSTTYQLSTPSDFPSTNPLTSRVLTAKNLLHANAITSSQFTQEYIPPESQTFIAKDGASYTCTFKRTQDLTPSEKETCFQIIKETSRKDYEANAEEGWNDEGKREEMGEGGMRFVLVRRAEKEKGREDIPSKSSISSPNTREELKKDDKILGFTSFTLELDPDTQIPQLYIYEIHLLPFARSCGLGTHLMSLNEMIARKLGLEKVMLTVFTCNSKAEGMYRGMGYEEDEESPVERVLRSGKVVRPRYLILRKRLLEE